MSRLKKSRQQGWQKLKRFNKQRNNIARSLHFLLHYFFITARLVSERFVYKILLYSIEQDMSRLKKSRQQGWQKLKRFNKQRNNIARSLHFLLHYFFITARLVSERFVDKILLYSIEQHIN